MLIKLYNENPDQRKINQIIDLLRSGGIFIYPTDTVYSMGCEITNQKAVEKVAHVKGIKVEKSHFSFICYDLRNPNSFVKTLYTTMYMVLSIIFI